MPQPNYIDDRKFSAGVGGRKIAKKKENKYRATPPRIKTAFHRPNSLKEVKTMAKDGTQRGGMRIGAGKKRKPLDEKIIEGKFEFDKKISGKTTGDKIKPPKKYLTAEQKSGGKLYARQIYKETSEWIRAHGCEGAVPKQLIENYAQVLGRHIQAEEYLSQFGLLAKHPTTSELTISPFIRMSLDYMKQAQQLWYQIYSAVRDNAAGGVAESPQSDMMERLLRRVK